jgi:hypothetical protein
MRFGGMQIYPPVMAAGTIFSGEAKAGNAGGRSAKE